MIIPVGIKAVSGSEISISATAINFPVGINIYLEDKVDNTFTLLDNTSVFTTTLSSNLDGVGRFYLHTNTSALSAGDFALKNISVYASNKNNLRIVGVQNGTANARIYSVLGKQILNISFEGNGLNDLPLPNLNTGIYIVQVTTETGILNKKINIE